MLYGNPLQCSCLENPRDGGAWWAAIYGVAQSQTRLKRLSSSSMQIMQLKPKCQSGTACSPVSNDELFIHCLGYKVACAVGQTRKQMPALLNVAFLLSIRKMLLLLCHHCWNLET